VVGLLLVRAAMTPPDGFACLHLRLALITVGVNDLAARLGGQCPPRLRDDGVFGEADRAVDQGDVDAAGIFERLGCSAQSW
jgi:hypothetical protein